MLMMSMTGLGNVHLDGVDIGLIVLLIAFVMVFVFNFRLCVGVIYASSFGLFVSKRPSNNILAT